MSSRFHRLRLLVALLVTLLPLSWASAPTVLLAAPPAAEAEAESENATESSGVTPGSTSLACFRTERRAAPSAPVPGAALAHPRHLSPPVARAPRVTLAAERLPYRHWRRFNGIGRPLLM